MKVSAYILGARMHYAVPSFLAASGRLSVFYTDFWSRRYISNVVGIIPSEYYKKKIRDLLSLRRDNSIKDGDVVSLNLAGVVLVILRRFAKSREFSTNVTYWSNKFFCTIFALHQDQSNAVYCMNTAALEIFNKHKGKKTLILEQCMVPRHDEIELIRSKGMGDRLITKTLIILAEREVAEWNLADIIVVPSSVVGDSLIRRGVSVRKIKLIPYGVDNLSKGINFSIKQYQPKKGNILKLLFVGEVGVRKGFDVLINSIKQFNIDDVELIVVGKVKHNEVNVMFLPRNIKIIGIVPRSEVCRYYDQSHVFVLPSLLEGSATVTYEAILSGLPIITTENAGSLVKDNCSGFIVESGSSDSLCNAIRKYLNNPHLVMEHSTYSKELIPICSIRRYERDICDLFSWLEYDN